MQGCATRDTTGTAVRLTLFSKARNFAWFAPAVSWNGSCFYLDPHLYNKEEDMRLVSVAVILLAGCEMSDPVALSMADSGVAGDYSYYKGDAGLPSPDKGASADAGAGAKQIPPEEYGKWKENDFIKTADENTSTFSIDVDTASYTVMRQAVKNGMLPDANGVRVEEYINYFEYTYPQPKTAPFSIQMEGAPSHFGTGYHLLRVGLQGKDVPAEDRKQANLIFLVDVSGSMSSANKLPLVKFALTYLVKLLHPTDTLGIVTYSNTVKELLQPTAVKNKASIIAAISTLSASGGTAGGPGIQKAYAMAKSAFLQKGINRVILCTDGDFNIGITGSALISYVEQKRKEGVTLSVLGFGMGNFKDALLEQLSNKGNGNYAYVDDENEAKKVFGKKLVGTLQVIAKDVKVQVEFNKKAVIKYRLVGYENRLLKKKDFKDDKKDAGEIGANHSVTAFYELEAAAGIAPSDILALVRFRYKEPDGTTSKELIRFLSSKELGTTFLSASADFRFAAAVVEYAEILRKSKHSAGALFSDVKAIASGATIKQEDRVEFLGLVDKAKVLCSTAP